ncbi:MAG: nucleotidyltransferase domain-containing protein [Nitrospinae bacterium]|nr:nucleotidyltransferase domain-containing protein [Nitrospinota bacterium]
MVEESIIKSVKGYLRDLTIHGVEVEFGVVFGSWAAGTATGMSDIDVIVVSPRFDKARARQDINLLWRVAARSDNRIEPIPCGKKQWFEDDASVIIEIARRGGELVYIH